MILPVWQMQSAVASDDPPNFRILMQPALCQHDTICRIQSDAIYSIA
jgi:hypothetical protein